MEERTPGRRSFLLPGPTFSGFWNRGRRDLLFPTNFGPTPVTARPPAGRAGKRGLMDGGRGLGKIQPKNILPKESFQIRARTWVSKKTLYRSAAPLSQKIERAPASGLIPGGAGGNPLRLFASGLSLEKAWIPAPDRGGGPRRRVEPAMVLTGPPADTGMAPGPTWQVSPCAGRPCRHVPLSLRRRPPQSPRSCSGSGPGPPPGPRRPGGAGRRAGRPSR